MIPFHTRLRRSLVLLVVAVAAACQDSGTEPDAVPTGIAVQGLSGRLTVGATGRVTATIRSSTGRPVTGLSVSWTSRDTTTVAVDATGNVRAVLAGEAWVVARAGAFSDSVLVEVAFALLPGEGRARLRSGTGADRQLVLASPDGAFVDFLSRSEEDFWVVAAESGSGDTTLVVLFPEQPTGARQPLLEWTPGLLDTMEVQELRAPLAVLTFYEGDIFEEGTIHYVPLEGWVEAGLDGAVPPAGSREALMHARVSGSGTAWYGSFDDFGRITWTPTSATHQLVADLRPTFVHETTGTSTGEFRGTGFHETWSFREADWWEERWGNYPIALELWGDSLTISTMLTQRATSQIGLQGQRPAALNASTPNVTWMGNDGQVEITEYVAPTGPDLWGEVKGRVTSSGAGMDHYQGRGGYTFTTTFDFHAPVHPRSGFEAPAAVGPSSVRERFVERLFAGARVAPGSWRARER